MISWSNIPWFIPVATLVLTCIGVILAYQAYVIRRRRHNLDSLMKLAERFESDENRKRRNVLYQKPRDAFSQWTADERSEIHRWLGELDLASLIASGSDLNRTALFDLYGDVFIRSLWLLAPYIDSERSIRGKQFALPLALFYPRVVKLWRSALKQGYPEEIGQMDGQGRISLREFQNDVACRKLVQDISSHFGWRGFLTRLYL